MLSAFNFWFFLVIHRHFDSMPKSYDSLFTPFSVKIEVSNFNCEYTYLDISPKRGSAGMEQCGVLPEFKGIAMHDCWASYWNYPDIQHAVCCAHLLRELTGIDENHPEGMSAHDIKLMSDNDLLDMDYFLHEFDDDDDFGEEGFYLF